MLRGDRESYVALAGVIRMRHGCAVADQTPGRTQRHRELEPFPRRIRMLPRDLPEKAFAVFPRVRCVPTLKAGYLLTGAVRHKRGQVVRVKPAQCHARPCQLGEAFIGHDVPLTYYAAVGRIPRFRRVLAGICKCGSEARVLTTSAKVKYPKVSGENRNEYFCSGGLHDDRATLSA